jgi:hypothetical protein
LWVSGVLGPVEISSDNHERRNEHKQSHGSADWAHYKKEENCNGEKVVRAAGASFTCVGD